MTLARNGNRLYVDMVRRAPIKLVSNDSTHITYLVVPRRSNKFVDLL